MQAERKFRYFQEIVTEDVASVKKDGKQCGQHRHDKVSSFPADSCLYIRLPFEQAIFWSYLY